MRMAEQRFCLTRPLTAVQGSRGTSKRVTIPANSILVAEGLYDAGRIMGMRWKRRHVFALIEDLQNSSNREVVTQPFAPDSCKSPLD